MTSYINFTVLFAPGIEESEARDNLFMTLQEGQSLRIAGSDPQNLKLNHLWFINPFNHSGHCIGPPSKISILV